MRVKKKLSKKEKYIPIEGNNDSKKNKQNKIIKKNYKK